MDEGDADARQRQLRQGTLVDDAASDLDALNDLANLERAANSDGAANLERAANLDGAANSDGAANLDGSARPPGAGVLRISELFSSIQGEGASAGEPCVFLRLALCNLRCSWCDTKYTWDWRQYRYAEQVREHSVAEIAERLLIALRNQAVETGVAGRPRLVLTGGEPLIQGARLVELLSLLPADVVVEVETNGTLQAPSQLLDRVDQWNVSPKLSHSGDPLKRRIVAAALTALLQTDRAWLKLVVDDEADVAEAEQLIAQLSWPRERVLLMPQAQTRVELARRLPVVQRLAAAAGLGYCTRLHVERWDDQRGV